MDIHDFILSIISFSTDMSHDSGFYLLEDGLELWLAIVENINEASPDIMQLFSKMPVLLGNFIYMYHLNMFISSFLKFVSVKLF